MNDDFITIEAQSGRIRRLTKQQVADLKEQPGIRFSETSTKNPADEQIEVIIPAEFGGGYVIGTTPALAFALNTAGITAGLVPKTIIRALLEIFGTSRITITLTGILVLILDKFSR